MTSWSLVVSVGLPGNQCRLQLLTRWTERVKTFGQSKATGLAPFPVFMLSSPASNWMYRYKSRILIKMSNSPYWRDSFCMIPTSLVAVWHLVRNFRAPFEIYYAAVSQCFHIFNESRRQHHLSDSSSCVFSRFHASPSFKWQFPAVSLSLSHAHNVHSNWPGRLMQSIRAISPSVASSVILSFTSEPIIREQSKCFDFYIC